MYQCNVIVDLEFNPVRKEYNQPLRNEIIEIGAVKLNPHNEIIGRFSCLVKPRYNFQVEPEITKLTGIRTSDILEAPCFEDALETFSAWIGNGSCRIISWSDSDMYQIWDECYAKNVYLPDNLVRWMDFQKVFQRIIHYPHRQCMGLSYALDTVGIKYDKNSAHRGLYDSEITAELFCYVVSPEYKKNLERAKRYFCSSPELSTFSLDSSCGSALQELMARLQGAS